MGKKFLDYIKELKIKHNFEIVDTHIHPMDVMGIVYKDEVPDIGENGKQINFLKPGLMERLEFGKLANFLSNNLFNLFTDSVVKEIELMYDNAKEKRILDEMEKSMVDKAVLLPVEPWAETFLIKEHFKNKNFLLLGSLDIHKIKSEEIESLIEKYVKDLAIVGLKLHPNLQNFKPQPSDNEIDVGEKLKIIYKTAEKHKLYLLFHGGISSYTDYVNSKYGNFKRSKNNALLENFCHPDGESEIFGKYDIPIVIAHLGHFGLNILNKTLIKTIIQKYDNIYFDTAAVPPRMIKQFIESVGSEKIILGSDALYNKMIYGIYFVYKAVKSMKLPADKQEGMLVDILGKTYNSKFFKK